MKWLFCTTAALLFSLWVCFSSAQAEINDGLVPQINISPVAYSGKLIQAQAFVTNTMSTEQRFVLFSRFKRSGIITDTFYASASSGTLEYFTVDDYKNVKWVVSLEPGESRDLKIYAEGALVTSTEVISEFFRFSTLQQPFPFADLEIRPNPTEVVITGSDKPIAFRGEEVCFFGQFPGTGGTFRFSGSQGDFPIIPSSWEADKACVLIDNEVPSEKYSVNGVNAMGIPGNRRGLVVGWQEHLPLIRK